MNKQPNHFKSIVSLLNELHRKFPNHNIGKHISTAIDGDDLWGVTDKQLLHALEKYQEELEINSSFTNDEDLENIISQGMNLNSILEDDNGEDY